MRGKFVSILLIAVFFASLIANIGFVQSGVTDTMISVEPSNVQAYPGEYFTTDITIEHAENVYAWEVRLSYPPYRSVLAPTAIQEGPWLAQGGMTYFAHLDKPFDGVYLFGSTLLGPVAGVSGSGVLATITWNVLDAGEGPLTMETSLVNPQLEPLPHQKRDGFYDGVSARLVMINIGARSMHVGETKEFQVKVDHDDQKFSGSLQVKARIDNYCHETGLTTTFWSGQSYQYPPLRPEEYLYVDGYDATRQQWTEVGASPFLDAPGDGNYIEGTVDAAQHRWFSFEDLSTIDSSIVDYVQLEAYTDGPYNEGIDYDIYSGNFNWLGSMYGMGAPGWQTPRWTSDVSSDMEEDLQTQTGINDFKCLVYYYDPGGSSVGGDILDSLRLHVVFKAGRPPVYAAVDGYDATRQQWTEVGASPFLDAPGDGNYIEGTVDAAQHRWFSFEDVDVGDSVIDYVQLWGYTDGPYNEGIDYDIYSSNFNWLGSLYGMGAPGWQTPRWVGSEEHSSDPDYEPALLDPAYLNDFKCLVYYYDPGGSSVGGDILDALKLEVTFKAERVAIPTAEPVYEIAPGAVAWLGGSAYWPLELEDIGTYTTTVTVFFSYNGLFFVEATKHISEDWQCRAAK